MKVAVIQSSYIPWRGYFDIIREVDVFVFLDHVQFTKRDWRTRNKIKFHTGKAHWLTIPLGKVSFLPRPPMINEIALPKNNLWMDKHWQLIEANYKKATYFSELSPVIHSFYNKEIRMLSDFNQNFIRGISGLLGIQTVFLNSVLMKAEGKKTDLLINVLKKLQATAYVTGPKGKNYLEEEKFSKSKIELIYKDYSGYPEYPQLHGKFNQNVSILDLLFTVGIEKTPFYIWGWRGKR